MNKVMGMQVRQSLYIYYNLRKKGGETNEIQEGICTGGSV